MATFMANAGNVEHKWWIVDAAGKPMGHVAADVAALLRGKNKTTFTPHVDCGDFVIVINVAKSVLTGKKLENKYYYHHTGWVGHLQKVQYKVLMEKNPEFAFEEAVRGMLPANSIGRSSMTRLRIFAGAEHPHAAQKPEVYNID